MIKNDCNLNASSIPDDSKVQTGVGGCQSHYKLNEWQIRQYRQAIEENKWYMGERLGRSVSWEEAESDFLHNGYYGCASKWRKEYCSKRCHHSTECQLGQLFLKR